MDLNVEQQFKSELSRFDVMNIILRIFEKYPLSVEKNVHLKTSVKIEERVYFPKPYGSKKSLHISFTDELNTEMIFHITKKSSMKSLKEISAEAVMNTLKNDEDIFELHIPRTLTRDLLKASMNDWSHKYYRSHICKCCKKRGREQKENIEKGQKKLKIYK